MRVKILQPAVHKEQLPVQQVSPVSRKLCTQSCSSDACAIAAIIAFSLPRYIAAYFNYLPGKQYPIRISNDSGRSSKNVLNARPVFQDYVLVNKRPGYHMQENAILYLALCGLQDRKSTRDLSPVILTKRTSYTPFLKYNN